MRIWHKDMIDVLPDMQLRGQWRECCCIASNIRNNGTPNHLLVNKIMNYDYHMFLDTSILVRDEMLNRDRRISHSAEIQVFPANYINKYSTPELFPEWHNRRYLRQCYYNLQEKYDCGGISEAEWELIENSFDFRSEERN